MLFNNKQNPIFIKLPISISSEVSNGMLFGDGDLDKPSLDDEVNVLLKILLLLRDRRRFRSLLLIVGKIVPSSKIVSFIFFVCDFDL